MSPILELRFFIFTLVFEKSKYLPKYEVLWPKCVLEWKEIKF